MQDHFVALELVSSLCYDDQLVSSGGGVSGSMNALGPQGRYDVSPTAPT